MSGIGVPPSNVMLARELQVVIYLKIRLLATQAPNYVATFAVDVVDGVGMARGE